jgi:uncharacterized membrane protein
MTRNTELLSQAKQSLAGKWGVAVATFVVYVILSVSLQIVPTIGIVLGLVLSGPFALGLCIFSLNISRNKEARLEQIFDGFRNWGTAIAAYLLTGVFVLLWALLLIIPGLIAALAYSLTLYILVDEPELGAYEAMDRSKRMMNGYKVKLLGLSLQFFLIALLCLLTLGIGFLWAGPWMQVAMAKFYDDVVADRMRYEVEIGKES